MPPAQVRVSLSRSESHMGELLHLPDVFGETKSANWMFFFLIPPLSVHSGARGRHEGADRAAV